MAGPPVFHKESNEVIDAFQLFAFAGQTLLITTLGHQHFIVYLPRQVLFEVSPPHPVVSEGFPSYSNFWMPLGKLRLEKSGLCSIDLDLLENKDKFTGPHGELLGKVHSFLTTTSFKAIRGPDKQNLTKLQDTFRIAVRVALNGFLQVNMVPYLVQFTEACKQRSVFTEAILQEDMCFMKLPHMVFKPESVIETFKDFGGFMKELGLAAASVAHGADRMNAEVAQQWMQKWQTKCAAFLKAVRVFEGVPDGAAGDAVAEAALSTRMIFGLHLFHLFGFLSLVLRCLINRNKHATGYSFALVAAFNFVV